MRRRSGHEMRLVLACDHQDLAPSTLFHHRDHLSCDGPYGGASSQDLRAASQSRCRRQPVSLLLALDAVAAAPRSASSAASGSRRWTCSSRQRPLSPGRLLAPSRPHTRDSFAGRGVGAGRDRRGHWLVTLRRQARRSDPSSAPAAPLARRHHRFFAITSVNPFDDRVVRRSGGVDVALQRGSSERLRRLRRAASAAGHRALTRRPATRADGSRRAYSAGSPSAAAWPCS